MPRFTRHRLEDVPLDLALHALADPDRLSMVARLAATERPSCTDAVPCDLIPKGTLSNHLKLLRAAGLIETTQAGRVAGIQILDEQVTRAIADDLCLGTVRVSPIRVTDIKGLGSSGTREPGPRDPEQPT
ncbi:MAG: ArsR family transcriptional regulator [Rhizobiaceae bacterium]|nr:MAG: ArsR family transcriptional regulator [Rhizobiaceae bacterium]